MLGSDGGITKTVPQEVRNFAAMSLRALLIATRQQQESTADLEKLGFEVHVASPDVAAIWTASTLPAHLVAVDCRTDEAATLQWCRSFRASPATGHIPLIALTTARQDKFRIELMTAGVDDCLFANFAAAESQVRIRSVLRRAAMPAHQSGELRYADIVLDPAQFKVWRRGVRVPMTVLPFRLLQFLMMHPERIFSRDELRAKVWSDAPIEDVTIVKCVSRLRRSLNDVGGTEVIRRTPSGYSLDIDADDTKPVEI